MSDDVGKLRVGQPVWLYWRPGYNKFRVEAVGFDWAVVRSERYGAQIINKEAQWEECNPYPEEEEA